MKYIQCNIKTRDSGLDAYKAPLKTYSLVKTAECNIQLISQTFNEQDIRYKDATHIALTTDKTLEVDMRIEANGKEYTIKLVNNAGRLSQLILKEEHK